MGAPRAAPVLDLKLPGLDRGKQSTIIKETEEAVMQRIFDYLTRRGWTVLCTVHRYRTQNCRQCGNTFWPVGGYGATKGIGDLLIGVPKRNPALWLMADVKAGRNMLTPEQAELARRGLLWEWRCEEDADRDLKPYETEEATA
jgi:hypothetical protein